MKAFKAKDANSNARLGLLDWNADRTVLAMEECVIRLQESVKAAQLGKVDVIANKVVKKVLGVLTVPTNANVRMVMRAMLVMAHANASAVTPDGSAIPFASKELGDIIAQRSALTVRIMANAIQ